MTTGASNDIEQATKLERAMITRYGMSKEFSLNCSAETQKLIDEKVVELVRKQHEKAAQIPNS